MVRDTSSAFLFEIHSWAKGTSLSLFATQPLHQWPSMGLRGLWKKGFTIRLSEVGKSGVSKNWCHGVSFLLQLAAERCVVSSWEAGGRVAAMSEI